MTFNWWNRMRIESREILEKAILGKGSPLFLSKNVTDIGKYLNKKGFDVEEGEIKEYIAEQRSNRVIRKNNSERKISEVSRPVILPPNFMEWMHIDLCYLSKNRSYGRSSTRYVMVLTCGLSLYVYYEPCSSTKGQSVIQAFQGIFDRSSWLPEKAKKIFGDKGVEWENHAVKNYLKSKGIRFYAIEPRRGVEGERRGRGDVYAEISIRELRQYLEKWALDVGNDVPFRERLLEIEKAVNLKPRSSLGGISSTAALTYNPVEIRNIKANNRFKKRKSLKKNLAKPAKLPLFSIVKVRSFQKKELFRKEAYGTLSKNYYCVINVVNYDTVDYHEIASVFDLKVISESKFSHAELQYFPGLSVPKARYLNVLHNSEVVKRDDMYVYLKPEHCDEIFYASKDVLN